MKENSLWKKLAAHVGHSVVIVSYGDTDNPETVCLECESCGEVVLDTSMYDITGIK